MGTIVNAIAIIIGSLIGCLLKKGIKESYQKSLNQALGLAIVLIGLNGLLSNMLIVVDGHVKSQYEMILIVSLAMGVLMGEVLRIDDKLNGLSYKLEKKFKLSGFALGFISATLIYCVGAMAIIGALNDGLLNDSSVLYLKATLDGISSILLTASMGIGVLFSFIPVILYQGLVTVLASSLSSFLQGELLATVCMVGYSLVMIIGLNFLLDAKIKTANFLPALIIPIVYFFLQLLF